MSKASLEVKLPTIWRDEKQRWEESERREEQKRERERVRRSKVGAQKSYGKWGFIIKGTISRAQGYHHFPYERCYGGRWQRALLGRHGIQAGRNSEKIFLECQVCVLFLNKGRKVRYTFAFTVVLSNITQSIF